MNCFLYQLQFNTPVHFGSSDSALSLYSSEPHFRADTLFSALCHTAALMYGEEGVRRLISMAKEGKLLLSDSMPWKGDTLYLPKPYFNARVKREQPADQRKRMKKLAWISVGSFDEYCAAMYSGEFFSCEFPSFGHEFELTKALVPDGQDARPYSVGLYQFRQDAGLYFIVRCERGEDLLWLTEVVKTLGLSGIGGRISSGYGKFELRSVTDLTAAGEPQYRWLYAAMLKTQGAQMLLTTSLPRKEELDRVLEQAGFQLVRRSGFIASDADPSDPGKKQTQYFLDAGSVLSERFDGDVYPIANNKKHQVFRYSKPLFLGVAL